MCYLVPRSDVAEIWAAVALGWRWSFTVCQPGLGIVTRVSMGGLKGGREGRKEGRVEEEESKAAEESEGRGEGGGYGGMRRMAGQRSAACFCVTAA